MRPCDQDSRALVGDVGEFNIVNDDEVVEVGQKCFDLIATGFEQDGIRQQEGGEVALNAALSVEHEVVAALAGREFLDGIGDHAIEPADTVLAGDANPADIFERSNAGCVKQRRELCTHFDRCSWRICGLESVRHIGGSVKLRTLLIIATGYKVARRVGWQVGSGIKSG